jgi:hypothetical protein
MSSTVNRGPVYIQWIGTGIWFRYARFYTSQIKGNRFMHRMPCNLKIVILTRNGLILAHFALSLGHFKAGLWIRIDLIRIRIQHFCSIRIQNRIRIQAKTELSKTISFSNFVKSKFVSNKKNNDVIHKIFFF